MCDIYFDGQKPCLGGVLALDGRWLLRESVWTNKYICCTKQQYVSYTASVTPVICRTGRELWRLWTNHEIFALTCQVKQGLGKISTNFTL